MTDRELLELAAKAAEKKLREYIQDIYDYYSPWHEMDAFQLEDFNYWNPLEDDGDALRLAVKLGIDICSNHEELEVWADDCREPVIHDAGVATRRAIVRAAASIGKDMQ